MTLFNIYLYLPFYMTKNIQGVPEKVSDKIFPRRLPNGRGLRTNRKLCRRTPGRLPEVCLLLFWGNDQVFKDASQFSWKLVHSPRPLGSCRGKILSETFFWDTLYIKIYTNTPDFKAWHYWIWPLHCFITPCVTALMCFAIVILQLPSQFPTVHGSIVSFVPQLHPLFLSEKSVPTSF